MNLSQEKRKRMLEFLNSLKSENVGNEKNLIAINEIENELNNKKYGLIWEEHEENVDKMIKDNVPVFKEIKKDKIGTVDGKYNFLLEGDNLHSLYLLQKTHKGRINIIYIDPPYNTGHKDFCYSDEYIGKDDGFFHSKWISFFEKRLILAHSLLSDDGVIFISIDDNELANLILICNSIFGENNYVGLMTLMSNPRGSQNSNFLSYVHEYVLMYAKNKKNLNTIGVDKDEESLEEFSEVDENGRKYRLLGLRKRGGDWKKEDRPNMFYSIFVDPNTNKCSLKRDKNFKVEVIPMRPTGELSRWTWGREKFESENDLLIGKRINRKGENEAWDIFRKDYIDKADGEEKKTKLKTIWTEKDINYQNARNELKEIFNNSEVFSFPKPTYLVKRLVSIIEDNNNAVILDYFAGSGTTGQAIIEMNKQDGGNRQFILCTNNENEICSNVTYPRLKTVITGKRIDNSQYGEGLPYNIKHYKTDFVPKDSKNLSRELSKSIKELVELENGVDIDNKEYIMILNEDEADEFEKNYEKYKKLKGIYRARCVVWTGKQKRLIKGIQDNIIPDYYFDNELKEVGENW